jgi:hypothetical protein
MSKTVQEKPAFQFDLNFFDVRRKIHSRTRYCAATRSGAEALGNERHAVNTEDPHEAVTVRTRSQTVLALTFEQARNFEPFARWIIVSTQAGLVG